MIDFGLSIKRNHGQGDSLGAGFTNGFGRGAPHTDDVLGQGFGHGLARGYGHERGYGFGEGHGSGAGNRSGQGWGCGNAHSKLLVPDGFGDGND